MKPGQTCIKILYYMLYAIIYHTVPQTLFLKKGIHRKSK